MGGAWDGVPPAGTMSILRRDECVWVREEYPWVGVKVVELSPFQRADYERWWCRLRILIPPATPDLALLEYGHLCKVLVQNMHPMQEL